MSSTNSFPPPRPSLLDLLLISKRAFLQSQQIHVQASQEADDISRACVQLLGDQARKYWVNEGKKAERKVSQAVELIAKRTEEENEALIRDELETTNNHRLSLLTSLSATLTTLSSTSVPASIHQTLPTSTASSSLFGSQANLSNKGEGLQDGSVQESGKNLRDFIDEQGMEELVDALDEEQGEIDNLLPTLLAIPEALLAPDPKALSTSSPVPDPKTAVQDALNSQREILEFMRSEMDALARHLDQVGDAVRDGEEGEEVDVLIEDTAHLPSVLEELSSCLVSLQHIRSSLEPPPAPPSIAIPRPHPSESLESHTQLHSTIRSHLSTLSSHLDAVKALTASLERYYLGFGALQTEVERREQQKQEGAERRRVFEEEERKLENEEQGKRVTFLEEWAESLPSDLWSFSGENVEGWEVKRVR